MNRNAKTPAGRHILGMPRVLIVCGLLLSCGTPQTREKPPLHEAALWNRLDVARQWIASGESVDVTDNYSGGGLETGRIEVRGETPLMVAAQRGNLEFVRLLVEEGHADLYRMETVTRYRGSTSITKDTALDQAIEAEQTNVAVYLWEASNKEHLLDILAIRMFTACLKYCDDKFGTTPRTNLALFLFSLTNDPKILADALSDVAAAYHATSYLEFLLRHGVAFPPNTLTKVAAVAPGSNRGPENALEVAQLLLDHGADPNALSEGGRSPLMIAAGANNVATIKFLLAHGADAKFVSPDGADAVQFAGGSGCSKIPESVTLSPSEEARVRAENAVRLEAIETLLESGAPITKSHSFVYYLRDNCCTKSSRIYGEEKVCEVFGF